MTSKRSLKGLAATALLAVSVPAAAETWYSNGATSVDHTGSVYWAEFDAFGGLTDDTPDVGSAPGATYRVQETSGGAFVTSGGNIYSFSVPTVFEVSVTADAGDLASGPTKASLRLQTLGTELDYDSVTLNGVGVSYADLIFGGSLGGFGGGGYEVLYVWNLASGLTSALFEFRAAGSSMSLSKLAVDIAPVPLPAAAWLLGSALVGLTAIARRRKA